MKNILLLLVLLSPLSLLYGQHKTSASPIPMDTIMEVKLEDPGADSLRKIADTRQEIATLDEQLSKPYSKQEDKINDLLQRGLAKLNITDTTGAITDFNTSLELDSTTEYAWNTLGIIYAGRQQWNKALAAANNGLEKCTEKKRLYLLKASCYSEMDNNMMAISLYDKAITLDTAYVLAFYNRGYTWFKMHQFNKAIADLQMALEMSADKQEPDFSVKDACFYLGTAYQKAGIPDSALTYLDIALEIGDYWTYYNNKTTLLTDLKRYDEALKCINKAISLYPDTADLYYARSNIYLETKQYEQQLQDLNKTLALDPVNISALINKGVYYERQNNIKEALLLYRQVITLDPQRFEAYSNIANILKNGGVHQDSTVYYYQKALEYAPDNAAIHFNYGNYFMKMKEGAKAISEFRKVITLDPAIVQAYNNMATIYLREGDETNGKLCLLQGLSVDKNDRNLNTNLLNLYFKHAQYDSAIDVASGLISLDDDNTDAYFKRGMSRQFLGMYENAVYDYLDCLKYSSESERKENSSIYANIGYCYLELKQPDHALKYFKTAVANKPETDPLIGLFTVYYLKQDQRNFRQYFHLALSTEPRLKKGMKGITQLEKDGFFYTPAHKEILKKIFEQHDL